ncbi:MAG: GNAT family N-acetyltransferase [Proteobacteria bacterium]|nr:GNAT family N-acetyltransferase [Pseudomonadota bacterium]
MSRKNPAKFEDMVVDPAEAIECIEPGMSIFIGTGVAEPRTLVKHLMDSHEPNLQDLELIQIISFGDAISLKELSSQKFRLKTFFSGWTADEAISSGRVDYIPSRYSEIPNLIESGLIPIDAAFLQVTPPNDAGYCSLGVAADVARQVMEKASIIIGEINPYIPQTFGDTYVPVSDFDYFVQSTEKPIYFGRWPADPVFDIIAQKVASVIEDGSCIVYSIGPLFEALSKTLSSKKDLGIHSPFITDALMDLIKSGAVTNRKKRIFKGKSVVSYALGTPELLKWLDFNPLIEFQSINEVFSPIQIGRNPMFVAIIHTRKVDLYGNVALHVGKGNVATGPVEVIDFFNGAEISRGGRSIFALSSRNLKGESNIKLSVDMYHNKLNVKESVDLVVTEYGAASLKGRTIRERAQALIEIAHPEDRAELIRLAKEQNLLYQDQIFLESVGHLYPEDISTKETFKNNTLVRFRSIKPSDEEGMRRLFYRFSDTAVYYRYFTPVTSMPHSKMQSYVNIDYSNTTSIVGLVGDVGQGRIIAEARFVMNKEKTFADIAFVVDEEFQNLGIASYLYKRLIELAKTQGLKGFTADVLSSNREMMKVFNKFGMEVKSRMEDGVYALTILFN